MGKDYRFHTISVEDITEDYLHNPQKVEKKSFVKKLFSRLFQKDSNKEE